MKEKYTKPAIESEEFSIEMMQGGCERNDTTVVNLATPNLVKYLYYLPTCALPGCAFSGDPTTSV
jgi:hypothetical protein